MLIDTIRNTIYMVGPGEYDLMSSLSPGTQQFACVLAPSGHMMIPCAEFQVAQEAANRGRLQHTPQLVLPVEEVSEAAAPRALARIRAVAYEVLS